jgi:Tfp pilus assembly protein PilE
MPRYLSASPLHAYNPVMIGRLIVRILVVLQVLAALAWPAHASTAEDVQHRALHSVLAHHAHDESQHLAIHDAAHGHDQEPQLSASGNLGEASGITASDHHHHDVNVSVALLLQISESFVKSHCILNPKVLPAMHSAEQRTHLRPPQV